MRSSASITASTSAATSSITFAVIWIANSPTGSTTSSAQPTQSAATGGDDFDPGRFPVDDELAAVLAQDHPARGPLPAEPDDPAGGDLGELQCDQVGDHRLTVGVGVQRLLGDPVEPLERGQPRAPSVQSETLSTLARANRFSTLNEARRIAGLRSVGSGGGECGDHRPPSIGGGGIRRVEGDALDHVPIPADQFGGDLLRLTDDGEGVEHLVVDQ